MDIELLQLKSMSEIRSLAFDKGIRTERTDKKIDIIKKLAEFPEPQKPREPMSNEPKTVELSNQDEIVKAIQENLERGLKIRFEGGCWFMRNVRGREDSGSLTMPVNAIKRIADLIT